MMDVHPTVVYEARIHEPEGNPSESGGAPDGQGPPEDAAPSSVVENILSKTPARNDDRLVGVGKDENGNPQGSPPRGYNVQDEIEDDTGDRVLRGHLPMSDQADAEAELDDLKADLQGADEYEGRVQLQPQGGITADEVREWYENNPDKQPTDADGNSFIPSNWSSDRHEVKSV